MALMIGTQLGWLNVDRYFDEVPERWALFVAAVATYLGLTESAVRQALDAGGTLAGLAERLDKDADVLKMRVTAALLQSEPSLSGLFLSSVVEHLVDLPWVEEPEDLAG